MIASGPGRRNVTGLISVPSRIREVSRARPAQGQVMVGAEERVKAELLGGPGDRQQRAVVGALLWFGENPQLHVPILAAIRRFGQQIASASSRVAVFRSDAQ